MYLGCVNAEPIKLDIIMLLVYTFFKIQLRSSRDEYVKRNYLQKTKRKDYS